MRCGDADASQVSSFDGEPIAVSSDRIWQVILPGGTVWIPPDSRSDDPRSSWIYARSTAEMFADQVGGRVVEVTPRQKEKVLDAEIASALAAPRTETRSPKTRTRPFARAARRAIATAILENVPLSYSARSAVDTARETDDDDAHKRALRTLQTALPAALWVGYDPAKKMALVNMTEPVWIVNDPQGEDPAQWQQITREEIAQLLVEAS